MSFSFVHAADLHLDCPFDGIGDVPAEVASALKHATFSAWEKIVDICIESNAAFLLVAGDVYNARDKSLRAQLKFRDGIARLAEAGIGSYVVFGNHDPADGWNAALSWPESCHVFSSRDVETRSVVLNGREIASITGISYPKRDVRDNLANRYQVKADSPFPIALLHCSCGAGGGHEAYAACTLQDLNARPFQYWGLGHIHTRCILQQNDPAVVYPGNPQGLNPKETGPRGCYLVHVDDSGGAHLEFKETDSVRWHKEQISIDGMDAEQELITSLRDSMERTQKDANRPCVVRFELTGRGRLHNALARANTMRDIENDLREWTAPGGSFVWVESIQDATRPDIDLDERSKGEDFVADFLRTVADARENPSALAELRKALSPLFTDSKAHRYLNEPTDEQILQWLDAAEVYGFDMLVREEE